MRVGVIGPDGTDSFADNVADCLPDLGVDAVPLGPVRAYYRSVKRRNVRDRLVGIMPAFDLRSQKVITDRAIEAECDVIITVDASLLPTSVHRIRAAGTKVVLWFPDHSGNLGDQTMFSAGYDRIFFTDPNLVERLQSVQAWPASYLPEACNPRRHRPIGEPGADREVAVVGNMYPSRVLLVDRLHADRVPLRIYGGGYPRWVPSRPAMTLYTGRVVIAEEKARVFRQAAGVLNNMYLAENGVNCRLFEATSSGGAVLSDNRPELARLFEPGVEVLPFDSYSELLSHTRRLLADPELTRKIGDAASVRALAEHTYQHRLAEILTQVA